MKKSLIVAFAVLTTVARSSSTVCEARGVWVCPWELNAPERVSAVVDIAREANLNAIFYEVRYRGDALYTPNRENDEYPNPEPRSPHLAGAPADFDPLADLIDEAHEAGIQVHAWVTVFVVLNEKTPTPEGHPALEHPAWLAKTASGSAFDRDGMAWLDPGIPEVRDYLYNVFMDIVVNYDIDGLHLDYVRYSDGGAVYNDRALAEFTRETGLPASPGDALEDWRRERITLFISRLRDGIAREKPEVQLSAAVFADRTGKAFTECRQDWATWLERGLVDFVVPMAYSNDPVLVRRFVEDGVSVKGARYLYAGLGLLGSSDPTDATYEALNEKIRNSRKAGADGTVIFSLSGIERRDGFLARRLGEGPFKDRAMYPSMLWKRPRGPGRYPLEVVTVNLSGSTRYGLEMRRGVPRRYAFVFAKEVSAWTDEPVYLVASERERYRVIAGKFGERRAAEALKTALSNRGY